jgi:hypothetical protein
MALWAKGETGGGDLATARNLHHAHGGVTGCIAEQKHNGLRYFLGRAAALHGHQVRQVAHAVGQATRGVDVGIY